jgi:hypothetical protein
LAHTVPGPLIKPGFAGDDKDEMERERWLLVPQAFCELTLRVVELKLLLKLTVMLVVPCPETMTALPLELVQLYCVPSGTAAIEYTIAVEPLHTLPGPLMLPGMAGVKAAMPSQFSSTLLSHISALAGLTFASLSLQSVLSVTYPAGAEQACVVADGFP